MRARRSVASGVITNGGVRTGFDRLPPAVDITSCQTVTPRGTPASDSSVEPVVPRLRSNRPLGAVGSATTRRTRKATGPDDRGGVQRRSTAPLSSLAVRLDGGASMPDSLMPAGPAAVSAARLPAGSAARDRGPGDMSSAPVSPPLPPVLSKTVSKE